MQASIATSLALLASAHAPASPRASEPVLLLVLEAGAPDEGYGTALASIGDLDRDGREDLAIGAPGSAATPGRVYIHSGASGQLMRVIVGDAPGDAFGTSLVVGGDLDGDGMAELWIGAPGAAGGAGRIFVHGSRDGRRLATIEPEPAARQPSLVTLQGLAALAPSFLSRGEFVFAAIGDLTGDGAAELALGFPTPAAGSTRGRVEVWSPGL